MSLQVLMGFLAAHPAKLVNLLALLITCPGGFDLRVPRYYYILGFACLAMALLLSWFSTWA